MASDEEDPRPSDADRDRTDRASIWPPAGLTLEEFDERLDKAYAAKTLGELDDLGSRPARDRPRPASGHLGVPLRG